MSGHMRGCGDQSDVVIREDLTQKRSDGLPAELEKELALLEGKGRKRSLRTLRRLPGHIVETDGARYLDLSSNDYLSFGCDPSAHRDFFEGILRDAAFADNGLAASASRLLGGEHPGYAAMEQLLESAYGPGRRALVLNSGYHANVGILPALAGSGDLILSDRLNHASIIDGIRLSRAEWLRYRHGDMEHLRRMLTKKAAGKKRVFVVTEAIFSMDGDCADLHALCELKREFGFVLYVDEAHAIGVRGRQGLGLCQEAGVLADVDILVGTFGKALASLGAFVIADAAVRDYLVNTMRSLIYTTALPPVVLGWSRYVFERSLRADDRRAQLARVTNLFRDALIAARLPIRGVTQIVPLVIGADAGAVSLANSLRKVGFWASAVRPPTVPEGTARLRLSLCAAMPEGELLKLAEEIARLVGGRR